MEAHIHARHGRQQGAGVEALFESKQGIGKGREGKGRQAEGVWQVSACLTMGLEQNPVPNGVVWAQAGVER